MNDSMDDEEDRKRTGAGAELLYSTAVGHAKTLNNSRENDRMLKSIQATVSILAPSLPLPPLPKVFCWYGKISSNVLLPLA